MSSVQLMRNARLWVSTAAEGDTITASNTQEILVMDDLSFSRSTSTSDIGLNEAGERPNRGSKRFNDAIDPAEWSFSTYIRSFADATGNVVTPDSMLWHALVSGKPYSLAAVDDSGVFANDHNMVANFLQSHYHELSKLTIYILMDGVWYKIHEAQVGQAEISFDIEGIAMTSWSGQGTDLETLNTQPFDPSVIRFSDADHNVATYIKNKLTVLKLIDNADSEEYTVPITGGSITFNNNITYLTPSTLSKVDKPIGSFTGTLDISGNITAYIRSAVASDTTNYTRELLQKMQADSSTTNSFALSVCLGGISTKADVDVNTTNTNLSRKNPSAVIVIPSAHLSVPTIESDEVIGTSIDFKAVPSDFSVGDEGFIGFANDTNNTRIDNLINTGDAKP